MAVALMQMHAKREDLSKKPGRLPVIAPKDDLPALSRRDSVPPIMQITPRSRLPPRSRTGCWTCRTRKVKCDEGRPTCGQCFRLGHACDYSPRLSFRDDTHRIIERMREVLVRASSKSCSKHGRGQDMEEDTLPPFALLTSDEEREKKAEHRNPGTFHVIVNPDSFSSLPEYRDSEYRDVSRENSTSSYHGSPPTGTLFDETNYAPTQSPARDVNDPDVVILSSFEETARRMPSSKLPTSPTSTSPSVTLTLQQLSPQHLSQTNNGAPSCLYTLTREQYSPGRLLDNFRCRIATQMDQIYRDEIDTSNHQLTRLLDIFEHHALTFPPLYHAMMALSALGLDQDLEALQHYQQVFPSLSLNLQITEDLSADGALLTHFLLLIYEIGAAEPQGSNLWEHHLNQLSRIFLARREMYGSEPYPSLLYRILCLDIHASLCGSGGGHFFSMLIQNNMFPLYNKYLLPLNSDGISIIYPDEQSTLPAALKFGHDIRILAGQTGQAAKEFRADDIRSMNDGHTVLTALHYRHRRIAELQEALKRAYSTHGRNVIANCNEDNLPDRTRATSMWSGQRLDIEYAGGGEVQQRVTEILESGKRFMVTRLPGQRFIMFSLFMAGFAATSNSDKVLSLNLMSALELDCIGKNLRATKQLLRLVFERQEASVETDGHFLGVDWMEVMNEQGLQLVNFGV
ncbi:MAG: hypothetical protein M1834_005508 [Cirrosporium novae-zelandiae]|nr:MAG: hypothetical protein M1834_005508 [Cirrosporium novae-zelandiae]